MKKILVAGAGHGGLVAAAYLAEKGYDVEVFEKNKREDMGYDWHDTMLYNTLEIAGVKKVNKADVKFRKDNTFFPPSLKTQIAINTPKENVDIEVDRKVLYNYLIDNAIEKGVKINYQKTVNSPLLVNGKVNGLVIDNEPLNADLVIDSAGMYSPVITKLPASYGIIRDYTANDVFHTYRAYYNLVEDAKIINPKRFNVYFKFFGIRGIAWFKLIDNSADVLIGSVDPLDMDKVKIVLNELRKAQPSIGTKLVRGGQIKDIPLKSTFPLIVGDNYAAIGDSVSMTVPLNGSGISNSIIAGKMLAETIIKIDQENKDYNVNELWNYQVKYFKEIGSQMISVAVLKNCLLNYPPKIIDFLFNKKILTEKELGAGATGQEVTMNKSDVLDKVKKGFPRMITLLKLKKAVETSKIAKQTAKDIPEVYDTAKVNEWTEKIHEFLK